MKAEGEALDRISPGGIFLFFSLIKKRGGFEPQTAETFLRFSLEINSKI